VNFAHRSFLQTLKSLQSANQPHGLHFNYYPKQTYDSGLQAAQAAQCSTACDSARCSKLRDTKEDAPLCT